MLERIQQAEGTGRTLDPSVADYLLHVKNELWAWLTDLLDAGGATEAAQTAGLVLIGALLPLGLLLLGFRTWRRWRRPTEGALPGEAPALPAAPALAPIDRITRALDAGDGREALAAGWEQLARALSDQGVGRWRPDQTEREFEQTVPAAWARRPALRDLRRAVVVGLYGPDDPALDHVRALLEQGRSLANPAPEAP